MDFFFSGCKTTDIQTQYPGSIDEGVETDFDDHVLRLHYASLTSSSGVVNFTNSKSLSQNLSCDSNFGSLDYLLSDSSELASSLPSCTSNEKKLEPVLMTSTALTVNDFAITPKAIFNKYNPLVHTSSFKTPRNSTRSPIDFREGRRASDGVVAQQVANESNGVVTFNSQKLNEKTKSKCMLDINLVKREAHELQSQYPKRDHPEDIPQRQKQHNQYPVPRSNKRVVLPDSVSPMEPIQLQTAMQQR